MCSSAYVLSVGQKTPWPVDVAEEGANNLILDAVMPILLVMLPRPTRSEIRILETGDVKFAVCAERYSGIFVARFSTRTSRPLYIEAPFHIGLEASPHVADITERFASGKMSVLIVAQDELHVARVLRIAPLSPTTVGICSQLVNAQCKDASAPGFEERHAEALRDHYAKHKDAAASYLSASRRWGWQYYQNEEV